MRPFLLLALAGTLAACSPNDTGAPEGSDTERGGESRYEEALLSPDDPVDPTVPQNPGEAVPDSGAAALADSALGN